VADEITARGFAAPWLMGIVNITPNSFSDAQRYLRPEAALEHCATLARQGAAILDLGAEASSFFRPGVEAVDAAAQLRRLLPVLEGLGGLLGSAGDATRRDAMGKRPVISIDTRDAAVARAALGAGADVINDISAGTHDPAMFAALAELAAPVVLMHVAPGYPTPPTRDDADIVATVGGYLARRAAAAVAAGIAPQRLCIDPGIGFGKTMADNWRLLARASEFAALGYPFVLGISRKRFLDAAAWAEMPRDLPEAESLTAALAAAARWDREIPDVARAELHPRDAATAALTAWAAKQGVTIHRVHNVALAAWALGQRDARKSAGA